MVKKKKNLFLLIFENNHFVILMKFLSISLILIFLNVIIQAKDYKAAVIQTPSNNIYPALIKAIALETNNNIEIEIVPSARAVYLIDKNLVDMICPATENRNPKTISELKYDFSTIVLFKNTFILYTNKNNQIDIEMLKKGNSLNLKIETTPSLSELFEFDTMLSYNVEASFKKVSKNMIDGFIYPLGVGDPILKKLDFKNIKRQLYSQYNVIIGIKKGTRNGEVDKMLTNGIQKLKANGKYYKIMKAQLDASQYDDWQL